MYFSKTKFFVLVCSSVCLLFSHLPILLASTQVKDTIFDSSTELDIFSGLKNGHYSTMYLDKIRSIDSQKKKFGLKINEATDEIVTVLVQQNLSYLHTLEIDASKLSDKSLRALGQIESLQGLLLVRKGTFTKQGISALQNIRYLQIVIDSNEAIEGLEKLTALCELDISYSRLSSGQMRRICGLSNLTTLLASDCGLTDESIQTISNLINLETLSIRNHATVSDLGIREISKLHHLEHLHICGSAISEGGFDCLENLVSLVTLTCDPPANARISPHRMLQFMSKAFARN